MYDLEISFVALNNQRILYWESKFKVLFLFVCCCYILELFFISRKWSEENGYYQYIFELFFISRKWSEENGYYQ